MWYDKQNRLKVTLGLSLGCPDNIFGTSALLSPSRRDQSQIQPPTKQWLSLPCDEDSHFLWATESPDVGQMTFPEPSKILHLNWEFLMPK